MSKRSNEIVTDTIAKLTKRGRELMTAVGKGEFSFFDDGIVANSGIWGGIMAEEFFASPRSASGVMNGTAKLGLWDVSEQDGTDGPDAGAWWALTELGAAVANELAGVESAEHNCVLPTPEEAVEEAESADAEAAAEFTAEPVEQAEDASFAADAIKDWRGNYNTVFAPAAELIAAQRKGVVARTESVSVMLKETHIAGVNSQDLLDELAALEEASTAALRAWQKTQDRKGLTDMEKFNQNRSFLAGYCAAATGSKKLPTIAFAKDMDKALRADAHAAGAAARKAAK